MTHSVDSTVLSPLVMLRVIMERTLLSPSNVEWKIVDFVIVTSVAALHRTFSMDAEKERVSNVKRRRIVMLVFDLVYVYLKYEML